MGNGLITLVSLAFCRGGLDPAQHRPPPRPGRYYRPGCCYRPAPSQRIRSPSPRSPSGGLHSHGPPCFLPSPSAFPCPPGPIVSTGPGHCHSLGIPVPLCLGGSFPVPMSERVGVYISDQQEIKTGL